MPAFLILYNRKDTFMRYIHCPQCGLKLIEKEIGDEGLIPYCTACERPWFDVFSTCVIVLVVNEYGEAALLRQAYISHQYHNLVSGFMKPGENAEYTAAREVEEELGLKVEKLEPAGTFWYEKKDMLMVAFFAHAKKQDFSLSCEVDTARWVTMDEALDLVAPKGAISRAVIEKYIQQTV